MPAFSAVGAYVAGTLLGLAGTAAVVVGAIVATGAAYITSRVINGNPNKGNNSAAGSQGGRIQVPPATNNKIPVVYGSAYVNGIITDARLISLENKVNDRMYYCIVLSEYTNNLTTPVYGLESAYWNDLRLTPLSMTSTESHIVKDGRKVVDGAIVTAGSFVVGKTYVITLLGNTDFTAIGAATNNIGQIFTATGVGTGTGQAQLEDFIDTNFIVDTNQYVQMRVYAGGSAAANQIFPANSNNKANAWNFWGSGPQNPDGDGSWDSTYQMDGLVFAIVSVRYNGEKGFTGLPNMTFQLANNVSNPADVWKDYMTSERYGAGIPATELDDTARAAWYNFCEEDINYTNVAGETNQATTRYSINGVIDTSNPVKTNIDTIMQNGGAWLSYNVATGLWSPVIKKAVSAGEPGQSATYFTASRTGSTLTVTAFPNGRIEAGQRLYNSTGTLIGTISAQLAPTAGETAGQIGRYTTSTSGSISSTTFYTLPASTLEFSDDNIISGINLSSTRLDDLYNSVEVEFYNKYNKDQKAYSRISLDEADRNPNEPDNQLRMSLDLCNNSMQSDLLGQLELRQSRDDLVIDFTTNQYGIQTQAGDIIAVTSELYDWAPKYFRVMRVKEQENEDATLTANIQALEYNPDVYTIEPITEFSTSANIGIGVYGASPNLPEPPSVLISTVDADVAIPNFQLQVTIPPTGGPFDEIELYYTEGWDEMLVSGYIDNNSTPGTYSGVAGNVLTITSTPYGSINVGDYFPVAGGSTAITVTSQLTNNPVSKTWVSGGANLSSLLTLNNVTGLLVGNTLTGAGIEAGALILEIDSGTNTVRLDKSISAPNLSSVKITGTTGQFSCSATTVPIRVNQTITISGTFGGTGSITGYTNPTTYKVSATNGSTTFTLTTLGGSAIVTTAGTPTGLTYIFDQIAQGTYLVFGGIGTYTVDTTTAIAPTSAYIYDFPLVSDYKPLKKIVPEGNTATFTNNTIVTDVITTVPANTATYRRWFIKARMGIKKRFGEFSQPGTKDFVGGRFPFNPNPSGSGGAGVFSSVDINNTTPWLTFSTQPDGVNPQYGIRGKSTLDDDWFVGSGSTGNDGGYLELATADNAGVVDGASPIYARQYDGASPKTGAPWFGGNGTVVNELTLLDDNGHTIIPNNLTVDSGTLFVDATTNKVGVNSISPAEALDVTGNGKFSGNIAVNGGDITTTNSNASIFNGNAVDINIGNGATTAVRIGANASASTVLIKPGTILGERTTQNVFNTVATTVNAFGAATTINIGNSATSNNFNGFISLNSLTSRFADTTTKTSTAQFTLMSTTRNAMKAVVNITQGTDVHCCEVLVVAVDATTALLTVYGEMFNTSKLADFDADVSSGTLRLLVTPTSATSTVFNYVRDSLA